MRKFSQLSVRRTRSGYMFCALSKLLFIINKVHLCYSYSKSDNQNFLSADFLGPWFVLGLLVCLTRDGWSSPLPLLLTRYPKREKQRNIRSLFWNCPETQFVFGTLLSIMSPALLANCLKGSMSNLLKTQSKYKYKYKYKYSPNLTGWKNFFCCLLAPQSGAFRGPSNTIPIPLMQRCNDWIVR